MDGVAQVATGCPAMPVRDNVPAFTDRFPVEHPLLPLGGFSSLRSSIRPQQEILVGNWLDGLSAE
jgi:hypothetical protein